MVVSVPHSSHHSFVAQESEHTYLTTAVLWGTRFLQAAGGSRRRCPVCAWGKGREWQGGRAHQWHRGRIRSQCMIILDLLASIHAALRVPTGPKPQPHARGAYARHPEHHQDKGLHRSLAEPVMGGAALPDGKPRPKTAALADWAWKEKLLEPRACPKSNPLFDP